MSLDYKPPEAPPPSYKTFVETVEFDRGELIEELARALKPLWFQTYQCDGRGPQWDGEQCALNNYPNQHLKYQAAARAEAEALVERLKL